MQWSKAGLSGLQSQLAREMLSWVATPLSGQVSRLVRGVVEPHGRSGIGRVILWDGRSLGTSVAYDVPLVDGHGGNISPGDLVAALRHGLADPDPDRTGTSARDGFGIPVLDATTLVYDFIEHPQFHITDALAAVGAAFAAPLEADEPPELRLRGFLLLDDRTCRLYLDTPESEDVPPSGSTSRCVTSRARYWWAPPVPLLHCRRCWRRANWSACARTTLRVRTVRPFTIWSVGSRAAEILRRSDGNADGNYGTCESTVAGHEPHSDRSLLSASAPASRSAETAATAASSGTLFRITAGACVARTLLRQRLSPVSRRMT